MCSRSRLTAWPPLRPACRASSGENSCAVPCACAARPPLLAISRCLEASIAANPRLLRPSLLLGICGTPFHCGCSGPTGRTPTGRSEETSEPERATTAIGALSTRAMLRPPQYKAVSWLGQHHPLDSLGVIRVVRRRVPVLVVQRNLRFRVVQHHAQHTGVHILQLLNRELRRLAVGRPRPNHK